MNKKVHIIMNVLENFFVLLGASCMLLALMIHDGFYFPVISSNSHLLPLFGMITSFVVVSIELLLFHLQFLRFKVCIFLYYIVELFLALWVNSFFSFSGLIVIVFLSVFKNICRIILVEKMYKPYVYYELCKKFGIKLKETTSRKKNDSTVKNVSTKSKSSTKSKDKKSVGTKRRKSYA